MNITYVKIAVNSICKP